MPIRVALTGFGSVGQGFAQLLAEHRQEYLRRYGADIVLTGVADRGGAVVSQEGLDPVQLLAVKRERGSVAEGSGGQRKLAGDAFLDQAGADVLVEAASTNFDDAEPGWSYALGALDHQMDLVLASKGALVLHYEELMDRARARERQVLFSATIGAPLPVLELAERVLVGVNITGFEGIVNATTNQILTSMSDGLTYDDGVRAAQAAGVAETDPTLDVDGWDAAAKVVIIARALFGARLELEDVARTGIRGITSRDLESARRSGRAIKLIARAFWQNGSLHASVGPEERPLADTLGGLMGQEMGIVFHTDTLGHVTSTMQSTGGIPTALTVLRDVVNLARDRDRSSPE